MWMEDSERGSGLSVVFDDDEVFPANQQRCVAAWASFREVMCSGMRWMWTSREPASIEGLGSATLSTWMAELDLPSVAVDSPSNNFLHHASSPIRLSVLSPILSTKVALLPVFLLFSFPAVRVPCSHTGHQCLASCFHSCCATNSNDGGTNTCCCFVVKRPNCGRGMATQRGRCACLSVLCCRVLPWQAWDWPSVQSGCGVHVQCPVGGLPWGLELCPVGVDLLC